ncbi:MAG: diaminopimelate dehydrogenase [Oscillospiraceae bacterium]
MIKVVVVGYGNVGKYVVGELKSCEEIQLVGIVRTRNYKTAPELKDFEVVNQIDKLSVKPDVAILTVPSRSVPELAEYFLKKGIHTVDSYDIHDHIFTVKTKLDKIAKENERVSILSAGWDPGLNSVVRTIMQIAAPRGITYTDFGPGMSMGHTVALKDIQGVGDALAVTIPLGMGKHRRDVYIKPIKKIDEQRIKLDIRNDDYFTKDTLDIQMVDEVTQFMDMGHATNITRKGGSATVQNQRFHFDMQINNPALTAQILIASAKASVKQKPGCYTLLELPMCDLLSYPLSSQIQNLV